ncbi:MAG: DNA methyltransferase [bacterium]|nr:DNA methyltransferase [bacterium]MDE0233676.1 DNA methyltransferase [bacterium]
MNSASVDLIYLDPPFNSHANYAAPIGSKAAGAAFKDTWTLTDLDVEWLNLIEGKHPQLWRSIQAAAAPSYKSYLVYMAIRLLEMRRLLKPTGSIYLHCDPTMSHYLKVMMDAIFGHQNFRNEIIWAYAGGGDPPQGFPPETRHNPAVFQRGGSADLQRSASSLWTTQHNWTSSHRSRGHAQNGISPGWNPGQ